MRYGARMDKIPKWFLVMVGSAMLLIGGAMAVNAKTNHDKAQPKEWRPVKNCAQYADGTDCEDYP